MGLWNFVKNAGKKIGIGSAEAAEAEPAALKKEVEDLGLDASGLKVEIDGDTVKLSGKARSQEEKEKAILESTKTDIAWGNQIRSYVFQPYTMVNDHRTELKISDVQRVMDGDLDPFIEAFLKQFGAASAA